MEEVLEGRTQHQIATSLAISQPAVSKIVRRMEARLLADIAQRVDHQRARHTLRLEFLYGEAMRAWRASQSETLRRRQRKTDGGDTGGQTIAEIISENRHGDPRFLDEARKALADLRKLWGIDAPERMTIEAATPFAAMSDAALEAELARHTRLLESSKADPTEPSEALEDRKELPDEHE